MPSERTGIVANRKRITERVVSPKRELDLAFPVLAADRDLLLEGPPGTSKTTILRAITQERDIALPFVEGNDDLTPAKLVGHYNPARYCARTTSCTDRCSTRCRNTDGL